MVHKASPLPIVQPCVFVAVETSDEESVEDELFEEEEDDEDDGEGQGGVGGQL